MQNAMLIATLQNETLSTTSASNKLYTQLTIYSKSHGGAHKESRIPALKKRRSSTSDKPNDNAPIENYKRSKILETCEIYNRNNGHQLKLDNPTFGTNNIGDKKVDSNIELPSISNGNSNAQVVIF